MDRPTATDVDVVTFGALLQQLRAAGGWTQEALAERAGISTEAVGTLERGTRRTPRPDTVRRLADALELDTTDHARFLAASRASRAGQSGPSTVVDREQAIRLPNDPTPFIGRDQERAEVVRRLSDSRLLTLTGPGGVGKTRLALAVAAETMALFPDGVFFVPLAGVGDPRHLPAALAESIATGTAASAPAEERLSAVLGQRRALLLLDNFEHLLTGAPLIGRLLEDHTRLTILATSRIPLRLRAERRYIVPPMSLPDPGGNVAAEALTRHDATRLFLERWRAAGSRDEPDPEMLRTIAQICARLDGLPLAIELAAARAAVLSLPTLLARLTSRLKVLGGGPVDAPTRQQTLRGAIQWSYALLPPDRQALYRRVAVFAGGFTAEAAEAVCGDSLDGLIDLVDTSLLQPPAERQKTPRFSMLATIREYAWELLEESGEEEDLQRRHAEHFAALAEELERELSRSDQAAAMARLRQEVDNLRAALEWCRSGRGSSILGLRLTTALLPYWLISGGGAEGRYWLDTMMPRASEAPAAVRARAFHAAGVLAREKGDATAAWPLLETALALYREAGDERGTAGVLHALGYRGLVTGNYQQGILYLEEALAIRRAAGDLAGVAETLGGLSSMYGLQNKDDEAIALLWEAVTLRRELGDTWGLTVALATLGMTLAVTGDVDAAEPLLHEALPLQESLGNRAGTALSFYGLALVARQRGHLPMARDLCGKAIAAWHESGNAFQLGIPLREMAVITLAEGRAVVAAQLLGFAEAHEKRLELATPPRYRRIHDATMTGVRQVLPNAELEAAYQAGSRLSRDQAVALALA